MKRFLVLISVFLALCACKTQTAVAPLVIRDSVSVTYHPGTVLSLTDSTDSTDCAPTYGGAIKKEQIPQKVRVDTLIVERWHAEVCQPQAVCQRSGPSAEGGLSAKRSQFYKNCTLGFWILLIMLLGSVGFRILRIFMFRR